MKHTRAITPVPDWLDLGYINGVKVGDEVATLKIKDGKVVDISYGGRVKTIDDIYIRTETGAYQKKNNGAVLAFMGDYTFYYSANRAHIATAKKNAQRAQKKAADKEASDKKKLREFMQKLNALKKEYGASFNITFGEGSDTHGIHGEAIVVSVGGQEGELSED